MEVHSPFSQEDAQMQSNSFFITSKASALLPILGVLNIIMVLLLTPFGNPPLVFRRKVEPSSTAKTKPTE